MYVSARVPRAEKSNHLKSKNLKTDWAIAIELKILL